MKRLIVGVGSPREMVGIIDFEVVTTGVYGVKVNAGKETYTEGNNFGVADTLHHWEMGVLYLTVVLDAEDIF